MTPADNNEMWALICTHLDHLDRAMVGLPLVQTGPPRDWMEKILKTLGNYITDDPGDHNCDDNCELHHCDTCYCDGLPSCDRDHCPTNCSPNCHLTPTGAHDAKA